MENRLDNEIKKTLIKELGLPPEDMDMNKVVTRLKKTAKELGLDIEGVIKLFKHKNDSEGKISIIDATKGESFLLLTIKNNKGNGRHVIAEGHLDNETALYAIKGLKRVIKDLQKRLENEIDDF